MSYFSKPTPDFFHSDPGFIFRRSRRFTQKISRRSRRFAQKCTSARNKKGAAQRRALQQAAFFSIVRDTPVHRGAKYEVYVCVNLRDLRETIPSNSAGNYLPQISQIYAEGRVAKNKKGGVKGAALEQAAFYSIAIDTPVDGGAKYDAYVCMNLRDLRENIPILR